MFLLVDCNNFYASCEQVFNPSLRKKPLVVLSNNDGCIVARSKEAKQMGIAMGDPAFLHKDKKNLIMLSANFSLYADLSQRVMETLATFDYPMEIYSIDEAFLCIEGKADFLFSLSKNIQSKVKKWTGIDVSIGIGKTKTLSKLANSIAKKNQGIYILDDSSDVESILAKTPVSKIWGIGRRLSLRLNKLQIYSAKDLKDQDEIILKKHLGIGGVKTCLELKQIPCFLLDEAPEVKKSIACCRSFYEKVTDLSTILEALATHTQVVSEKMRLFNLYANSLCVVLSTSPFEDHPYSNSCTVFLTSPSNYTPDLISQAKWALEKIFKPGLYYKKVGVILLNFCKSPTAQLNFLFFDPHLEKKEKAMKALDQINHHYQKQSLYFAAQGILQNPIRERRSFRYTTCWAELPIVK